MRKLGFAAAAALAAALFAPSIASAATGYVTTNLNVRAGPSTQYPAVTVFPVGSRVDVIGCTSGPGWCDVQAGGVRGWVSASYLDLSYQSRRVRAPSYIGRVGIPTVTFSIGSYWDNHYRGRDFYRDRGRFGGPRVVAPRPDRRDDWRRERMEDRREMRQERRAERRELRQDRREIRREIRQDRREDRREWRRD
ncbi:SH3 domain-containing protein [Pararhizobium haloflavum]|uniref:SH3 domain-containing protein n=1 Tax=Pararhizobium haloflavum TaxID=2037914 RepID=UPI000C182936|nr:SH3 domain-containing protein [Pararhizobium haloflavum]